MKQIMGRLYPAALSTGKRILPGMVLGLLLMGAPALHAQQADSLMEIVRIELQDGSVFEGRILSQDSTIIVLQNLAGIELTLRKTQIKSIQTNQRRLRGNALWLLDPNRSRLGFTPTARPLPPGTGYIGVYEVFIPFVAYGITETVGVAGGVSLFPFVSSQLVYFGPKLTLVNKARTSVAGGAIVGTVVGEESVPVFGLLYGLGTFGSPYAAITVGLAYGFADDELADKPVIMLGGEYQVSARVKLLSENYVLPNEAGALVSGGFRYIGDRVGVDFLLVTHSEVIDEGGFPFLPFISVNYRFGKE